MRSMEMMEFYIFYVSLFSSDVKECPSNEHAGLLTFLYSHVNKCLSYAVCNFAIVLNWHKLSILLRSWKICYEISEELTGKRDIRPSEGQRSLLNNVPIDPLEAPVNALHMRYCDIDRQNLISRLHWIHIFVENLEIWNPSWNKMKTLVK